MERASRLIRKLQIAGDPFSGEQLACAAWPQAVGKKIAVHTRAARMVRSRLIVEVEDVVWQQQLFALSGQILRNLEKHVGPGVVGEVEFRVVPARRPPAPARRSEEPSPAGDEADRIADPVLRAIYKQARKRALA